ncbi:23S rRNA (cytidine1920-2'-O)/16S rRNA (cytidine1409-2'-O)-methyltransferase [Rhodobium orientis]|uniref:TlyA family rRNA (Cytidine-2'-O)-methyltransferase n=1 Tax=Rhodobium orientis TaxID=34017 RepID=A0A327JIC1_9HYPH|nr:TlyA family RNA methyltransferase [Rhodobium orientis]MBB4303908.1 23S rRNA (cytidine1920-2'-O)/16S rRNA (cytidine1409-2'-O)-methyltransferase [Rhodobium orientis]MBK5951453.1 TlyA family rRNA (cytidine-2'-O)-methyltransferase [Rhodobium orientis]RAI26157.1 TlyA family rRNA (cytidine-2'-O)-methyltransferase [Rhodobium orientis]
MTDRQRLDQRLVALKLADSRARARDAILRGTVTVDGTVVEKPGALVSETCAIAIDDPAAGYVSRAALKLIAGLDAFGFDPAGLSCLDIGASTGGFTQVLLERGARGVTALDVGHGQLHDRLRADERVLAREGLNARDLKAEDLPDPPEAIVSDVSFISLKLALGPALDLAAPGAFGVFLIKPQFEVGREHIGKGGIVRDAGVAEASVAGVLDWIGARPGWRVVGTVASPISGADGNRETVAGAIKDAA